MFEIIFIIGMVMPFIGILIGEKHPKLFGFLFLSGIMISLINLILIEYTSRIKIDMNLFYCIICLMALVAMIITFFIVMLKKLKKRLFYMKHKDLKIVNK